MTRVINIYSKLIFTQKWFAPRVTSHAIIIIRSIWIWLHFFRCKALALFQVTSNWMERQQLLLNWIVMCERENTTHTFVSLRRNVSLFTTYERKPSIVGQSQKRWAVRTMVYYNLQYVRTSSNRRYLASRICARLFTWYSTSTCNNWLQRAFSWEYHVFKIKLSTTV